MFLPRAGPSKRPSQVQLCSFQADIVQDNMMLCDLHSITVLLPQACYQRLWKERCIVFLCLLRQHAAIFKSEGSLHDIQQCKQRSDALQAISNPCCAGSY